jgi:ribonuclease Z
VQLGSVDNVFFTHMHSDHITDLPDFMMMRWTMGAAMNPLHVYGPQGTREAVEGFRAALNPDVRYRFAHHGEKLSREGIEVVVHEIVADANVSHVAAVGGINVGAFTVDHRPVEPAFGYRVDAAGASAVFSGDTVKVQSLVDAARGADVLISEAVHLGMMGDRIKMLRGAGNERVAVMMEEAVAYHAPTLDVAEMARDAGVAHLVLTHVIPPIPNEGPLVEQFVAGMSDIYAGPITVAQDMQKLMLGD